MDVDIQGVNLIREAQLDVNLISILPPDFTVLEQRLRGRGTDDEAAIAKRLETAIKEVEEINKLDFWVAKIVNDDLEVSYGKFKEALAPLYTNIFS